MTVSQCYSILGLPLGADKADVKKAYRRLAKVYHPDRNQAPSSHENFILIEQAYSTICSYLENGQVYQPQAFTAEQQKQDAKKKRAEYAKAMHKKRKADQDAKFKEYVDHYYDRLNSGWRHYYVVLLSVCAGILAFMMLSDLFLPRTNVAVSNTGSADYARIVYHNEDVSAFIISEIINGREVVLEKSCIWNQPVQVSAYLPTGVDKSGIHVFSYVEIPIKSALSYIYILFPCLIAPAVIQIFRRRNLFYALFFYRYVMYVAPFLFFLSISILTD